MDFQDNAHLAGIVGDEDGITMDSEVVHAESSLELNVPVEESVTEGSLELTVPVQEPTVMRYLLPSTSIESIAEQEGIAIATTTLQNPQEESSMLKVAVPMSNNGENVELNQQSVFISLSQDGHVIVKKEEEEANQINQSAIVTMQTQAVNQEGEITLVNIQTDQPNNPAVSRAANSLVQLTHDGKVNIVSRESVIPQVQLQQVMLPDGSMAYLNTTINQGQQVHIGDTDGNTFAATTSSKDNLQAVRLDDGSIAYLTASIIPEGSAIDTSSINLEQSDKTQPPSSISEEVGESPAVDISPTDGTTEWSHGLPMAEAQLPSILQQSPPATTVSLPKHKERSATVTDGAYRCPFDGCTRVYTTLHHLRVHECTHTGDKPFQCDFNGCEKSFTTAYGLKSHVRVHTGEKPYKCPMEECTKAFKTSGDLQKHVRTHTGEKPFKCPFEGCNKSFTTSNIRKVHIRVHTGERPYICPMDGCGKSFSSATNYKNHVRIHTGERPYVCTVQGCGKRFTEYSSLYKHHIVHTHSKPYVCEHCGKTYRQTSTLAMHKRTAHNDESGATEAELVLAPGAQVFAMPGSEDNEGVLVINTAENNKTSPHKSTTSTTTQSSSIVTPPTNVIQTTAGGHEGLTLPPELQGQRVFVITEPAQLQILQHLAQSQQIQILNATEVSSAQGSSTQSVTAESLDSK